METTEFSISSWYCIRSLPKHEHIAAAHVRRLDDLEVFLPRIRVKRNTSRGVTWVTEPLFPGYIFGKFNLMRCLRSVKASPGVAGVVQFNYRWPTIEASVIEELRSIIGHESVRTIPDSIQIGDTAQVAAGAFQGLTAVVTKVMPSSERVSVLMEFLGRQSQVILPLNLLIKNQDIRSRCDFLKTA